MKMSRQSAASATPTAARAALENLLAELDARKRDFTSGAAQRLEKVLDRLEKSKLPDAEALISLHESLLFLAAYSHSRGLLRKAHASLDSFGKRVSALRDAGKTLSAFEYEEASGVSQTSLIAIFSYDVMQWLYPRFPGAMQIDEQQYENPERLAFVGRRLMPLLEEDSLVEAKVPFFAWLNSAGGSKSPRRPSAPAKTGNTLPLTGSHTLGWLLRSLARLPLPAREIAELYDSLELPIQWQIDSSPNSRTRMRFPVRRPYIQTGPLLCRADISLDHEVSKGELSIERLRVSRGKEMVAAARQASALRCRELYGFTYGDPATVIRASIGRGVEFYLWGVPPARRLPLRAYGAVLMIKNGTPIGYAEHMAIFDRMEIGFNIYYTFRDGESAWLYSQLMRLFKQVYGVTSFLVDPYQIGAHNEEAIASGSFWFYRKLGFRPMNAGLARLLEHEERKIQAVAGYRTPAASLRRLAQGYIIYESPGSDCGIWDAFHMRNIGLRVQEKMARDFNGDAAKFRSWAGKSVASALGIRPPHQDQTGRRLFQDFAIILSLIPRLSQWSPAAQRQLAQIIRSRTATDETDYMRLLQRHPQLREAFIKLGS